MKIQGHHLTGNINKTDWISMDPWPNKMYVRKKNEIYNFLSGYRDLIYF